MVFSVTLASGLIINVKAVSKEEVLLRFPDARTIVENPAIRDTANLPSVGRDGILRMAGSGEILTDADIESGRAAGTVFTSTTESTVKPLPADSVPGARLRASERNHCFLS